MRYLPTWDRVLVVKHPEKETTTGGCSCRKRWQSNLRARSSQGPGRMSTWALSCRADSGWTGRPIPGHDRARLRPGRPAPVMVPSRGPWRCWRATRSAQHDLASPIEAIAATSQAYSDGRDAAQRQAPVHGQGKGRAGQGARITDAQMRAEPPTLSKEGHDEQRPGRQALWREARRRLGPRPMWLNRTPDRSREPPTCLAGFISRRAHRRSWTRSGGGVGKELKPTMLAQQDAARNGYWTEVRDHPRKRDRRPEPRGPDVRPSRMRSKT